MSDAPIVCENCGKKFRLPESFKSPKAKCTQCGSAIDVAGQRAAAAAPPAATPAPKAVEAPRAETPRPAASRPASAKTTTPREEAPARPAAAERPARRAGTASSTVSSGSSRRGAKDAEDSGTGARRGRGEAAPKKNQMPLFLGAGGVVVLGVVAFLMMGGKEKPKPAAAPQPAAAAAEPAPNAEAPAATAQAAPAAEATKPAAVATAPTPAAKVEETKPAVEATPTPSPEATKPAAEVKKPEPKVSADNWMNSKVTSMDQVFDPKKETEDVVWAAYVTDTDKTEIMGLLDVIRDGGVKSAGAKTKLEKMGHKATFGIISRLREIDYKDSFDAMYGWELNKVLETITGGMNVGYAPVLVGEDMDPRKADWNARTAKAWLALPKQFDTEEAFEAMVKKRRERSK